MLLSPVWHTGPTATHAAFVDLDGQQLAPTLALAMRVTVPDLGITSAPVNILIADANGAITKSVTFQVSGQHLC